uniref:Uncharacterized protein n=1 Tax=Ditylenchus dipsaci TaxID=166011 RepID=A0A915DTT9_9BILA
MKWSIGYLLLAFISVIMIQGEKTLCGEQVQKLEQQLAKNRVTVRNQEAVCDHKTAIILLLYSLAASMHLLLS